MVPKSRKGKSTSAAVADTVQRGQTYDVISYQNGWVKINTGKSEGYLKTAGQATVVETAREKVDEAAAVRAQVVDFALQFVGNPYVYGGSSLTNGADCSGFVMSVYQAFGISLPHSSSALRSVGYGVSLDAIQPGDIVCYSGHVGIYAGNNTLLHASSPSTGIKYTSPVTYREILAIRRIF